MNKDVIIALDFPTLEYTLNFLDGIIPTKWTCCY